MTGVAHASPSAGQVGASVSRQVREADETVGGWLLGLIDGRGNSPSQIMVSAVLGCVPIVGQLFDLRDLVRCIIALTTPGAGVFAWVELVVTIIGCIPGFGDAFKAGVKLAEAGARADRVFDAMRRYARMDPERALRQMDWARVQREATRMLNDMLDGIVSALDGWLVQIVAGKHKVRELIEALRDIKRTAPEMIRQATDELRRIVNGMLDAPRVASTAQVSPVQSARRSASTSPSGTSASAPTARPGGRQDGEMHDVGKQGGGKQGGGKNGAGGSQPSKPPRDGSRHNPAHRGVPNSKQIRQSKRRRWGSGVSAEHIVDYYSRENRRGLRKINDRGRLVEEYDRSRFVNGVRTRTQDINNPGIDHLWFGPHRDRKYTVGETKGSTWAHFSFLAGMTQGDRDAVTATRSETADALTQGEYDASRPTATGREGAASVKMTDESALSSRSNRKEATLSSTATKGRQMSHLWVRRSIESDDTILSPHGVTLIRAIRNATFGATANWPYHREVYMVTGKQYERHDRSRGSEHSIQPPIIEIPDNVLSE